MRYTQFFVSHAAKSIVPLTAALVVGLGATSTEAAYIGPKRDPGRVIWITQYLQGGVTYDIKTANLSTGSDTVLHVYGYSWSAGDDDSGGGRASRLFATPPYSGNYQIMVRSYDETKQGTCDVFVGTQQVVTQAPFGGVRVDYNWVANERIGVAGTARNGGNNDFMLFLLDTTTHLQAYDDDSGPNYYPLYQTSWNQSGGKIVWARYPSTSSEGSLGRLLIQDNPHDCNMPWGNDWDCDALTDGFEYLAAQGTEYAGLNGSMGDTDRDTIPDSYEIMGNDGWSFSEAGSPVRPEVYIEVDYMVGKQPYANLGTHFTDIFQQDGNIKTTVIVDQAIPSSDFLTFYFNCGSKSSCAQYSNLKSAYFNIGSDTSRRHFHYAIFANRRLNGDFPNGSPDCASGEAEVFGNDLIVTLDNVNCGSTRFAEPKQRGTFIHEFGHNINFGHNGNDSGDPTRLSLVHASVMNYRYQLEGVPDNSGNVRFTYSKGLRGCHSCESSPKASCLFFQLTGMCGNNPYCDCDINEWSNAALTFTSQNSPFQVGVDMLDVALQDELGKRFTKERIDPLTDEERDRYSVKEDKEKKEKWVKDRAKELKDAGHEEGKHFNVSADGLHIYME